ncbi:MAG: HD domain-containing protein [Patescibacteria group bacterium]|jgi:putative hydrolase of HD superfamily
MLQVHDWPEHFVGDQITVSASTATRQRLKADKYIQEDQAMKRICADLGPEGKINYELWLEFEAGETPEGDFAKQLDRLQAMLQAEKYEKVGEPVVAQEFIDYDRDEITHPLLKEMLEKIDRRKV